MSNISVYNDSVTDGASVTATNVANGSGISYLHDDRLSYKFITTGTESEVQINLPVASGVAGFKPYEYIILSDHNLQGGVIEVFESPTISRTIKNSTILSSDVPDTDPVIIQTTSAVERTGDQFLTVSLEGGGAATFLSIGEMLIVPKFTSPQRPGIGIQTEYIPRTRYFKMATGERQSIKDAETCRKKTFRVGGLSYDQATEWIDLYTNNEGKKLVVLEDDVGDTYTCFMEAQLTVNDQSKIVEITLIFEEIKL